METALEKFCRDERFALEKVKLWDEDSLKEELVAKGYSGSQKGDVVTAWKQLQGMAY